MILRTYLGSTQYICAQFSGKFEGQSKKLLGEYGQFDFVWFDCGGTVEYTSFMSEYWDICCGYIFFHYTYSNNIPNSNLKAILDGSSGDSFRMDIVEPHKKRQGSITIMKKQKL